MKKLIAILFLGFVLTSCVDSYDNPINPGSGQEIITGDDASDKKSFTTKQMTVNDKGKSTKTVSLRYYSDMPHVAYISISDFLNMVMPSKKIKVSRIAASQYSMVTSKGETAKVNTADESMKFDDFMSFVSLNVVNSLGYLGKDDDDPSYVREMPMTYSPTSASVTLNMKKYGINLRGDGKMVYVPLTTLSDIYSDISCTHVFFNGEKIYTKKQVPHSTDEWPCRSRLLLQSAPFYWPLWCYQFPFQTQERDRAHGKRMDAQNVLRYENLIRNIYEETSVA